MAAHYSFTRIIFMSHIFHPCTLEPHFHVSHFQSPRPTFYYCVTQPTRSFSSQPVRLISGYSNIAIDSTSREFVTKLLCTRTGLFVDKPVSCSDAHRDNKKLSCRREAARCFVFVCSQLQHTYSAVFYYQLLRLQIY